jgi:hypothetical protein
VTYAKSPRQHTLPADRPETLPADCSLHLLEVQPDPPHSDEKLRPDTWRCIVIDFWKQFEMMFEEEIRSADFAQSDFEKVISTRIDRAEGKSSIDGTLLSFAERGAMQHREDRYMRLGRAVHSMLLDARKREANKPQPVMVALTDYDFDVLGGLTTTPKLITPGEYARKLHSLNKLVACEYADYEREKPRYWITEKGEQALRDHNAKIAALQAVKSSE